MDDLHRLEAKGLARAKIRSQRRRVSMIRRHTVRGSIALFVILWGVIFAQLATGNDPALSANRNRRQAAAAHKKANRSPEAVVPTPAPLPTEEPPFESEPVEEVEPEPEFEEEPAELEFESEPVEEAAPEPVEPIITSSS
ncbi:MAG: hypothetical protein WBM00_07120 [Solirubrobacterales bacterium]